MNRTISLLIALYFLLLGCGGGNNNKIGQTVTIHGTITISGAFALYPMMVKLKEEYNKIYPDVQFQISAGGAGKGITDALSGMVDLGMVSREITEAETEKGAFPIPVAKDAVIGVINQNNPVINDIIKKGISRETLIKIFITSEIKTWGEAIGEPSKSRERIQIFTRSDASGAAEVWAKYLGKKQEDLQGIGVFGDPGIAQSVQNEKNGIGYNNFAFVYNPKTKKINDNLSPVYIDLNSNNTVDTAENFYSSMESMMIAISKNIYPAPPARYLYLVSKSKPKNQTAVHFLKWMLTNGQKYINEEGFINLPSDLINSTLNKL